MTIFYSNPIKNSADLDETELLFLLNDFRLAVRVLTAWEEAECAGCQICEACRDLDAFAWDEVNPYMSTPADGCYDYDSEEYTKRLAELQHEYAAHLAR